MYPLKVGVREVGWTNTSLTINGRDVYIRGCGKHEDADVSIYDSCMRIFFVMVFLNFTMVLNSLKKSDMFATIAIQLWLFSIPGEVEAT